MNFKQPYVRKPVLKWPGNKTGKVRLLWQFRESLRLAKEGKK